MRFCSHFFYTSFREIKDYITLLSSSSVKNKIKKIYLYVLKKTYNAFSNKGLMLNEISHTISITIFSVMNILVYILYVRGKIKLHKIIIGEWVECHYHHNKPFCSIQWVVDYRDDEVQKYQKIVVLRISGSLQSTY